ncbi:MAG TPA: hypothetical protein VK599_05430 [Streptosporangiaceae bacterium]|nr:hypothetical protein [Streptosporangiaceae bacterium]
MVVGSATSAAVLTRCSAYRLIRSSPVAPMKTSRIRRCRPGPAAAAVRAGAAARPGRAAPSRATISEAPVR